MKNDDDISEEEYLKSLKIDDINTSSLRKSVKSVSAFPLYLNDFLKFIGETNGLKVFEVMRRMNDANTWIKKCNYLLEGINRSFLIAADLIDKNENLFVPFRITNEDRFVFYFIENAIYRLFSLWDTLAHLYHFYYELDFKTEKLHYVNIFNSAIKKTLMNKAKKKIKEFLNEPNDSFLEIIEEKFVEICRYINEKNEFVDGQWKGNHRYLKKIRNQFTHRDNPHDFALLNYTQKNFSMPDAPLLELKRSIDDYLVLYENICNILKLVTFEMAQYGIWFDVDIKRYNPMRKYLDDLKQQES
ncbi:Cthe_2314 family HEPN domain-containing protein [Paenibacillus polymyxa]|uniref:Cthe_2314 family HEPN domain-containing protein n=1 Tax=Paenibacillus polymyxa TaxID=1406 RepID=UPI002AB3FA64|nr:Cthe_2314 family HEPN domain-containing protein [Paenibacillus polymyxa]MDY8045903.1 Cthe_2314 family HEPN domain-containing protein [Paenibacillus polymyxa]